MHNTTDNVVEVKPKEEPKDGGDIPKPVTVNKTIYVAKLSEVSYVEPWSPDLDQQKKLLGDMMVYLEPFDVNVRGKVVYPILALIELGKAELHIVDGYSERTLRFFVAELTKKLSKEFLSVHIKTKYIESSTEFSNYIVALKATKPEGTEIHVIGDTPDYFEKIEDTISRYRYEVRGQNYDEFLADQELAKKRHEYQKKLARYFAAQELEGKAPEGEINPADLPSKDGLN